MPKNYEFKEVEEEILKFWDEEKIYHKANAKNKGKKPWYFLDGPPYTSGRMHLGQAWNKSMKDAVLRYKRMAGFEVYDRAGYDMHGLPTENKVQEKFGIKHKEDIPEFGVEKFVKECKKLAIENMKFMNQDFKRLGIWMDFENAYMPITNEFIDGEWWLVKKAHENERLYQGERVMHWCPSCATSLAKHELEYENDTDDSIFLKFKVAGKKNEYLIIWTTTPWTIPFNLGVMVNPNLDYVRAKVEGETWIVAKALAGALIGSVANKRFEVIETFKGKVLEGTKYEHPLKDEVDYEKFVDSPKLHTVVLSTEYVDLSSGSGLVHMAPGCGPEDYEVGYKNELIPFNNLDEEGVFPEEMGKFKGWKAKKDDKKFIEEFRKNRCLIETTKVEHEYAHCWRCKEPVIFRTTNQWFFKIEDLKDKMRALNKKVLWQPDWAGRKWFDSWLDNLRDNSITRQRYWGTPVPIWKCDDCGYYVVVGSIKELKKLAGEVPEDLHRPYIDKVEIKCECGSVKKRIPDILDVWIDAGTTSWTALDYPQKEDLFKKLYPPDFILEGKDQIRGWFNLLLVASMVSMQKHSYKAVYMHGFVNDALGRKMSKSLGNIISPYEAIDKYGADALRVYTIGGTSAGVDLNYNFDDLRMKHRNLSVLWNLHNFLIDYSKTLKINPKELKSARLSVEEEYIFSKLNSTIITATELFEQYRLDEIPKLIEELFLELSRFYIQITREKSSVGEEHEKKAVLYTVYNVLVESLKLMAPLAPFISEKIYQNLKEEFKLKEESIHLFDWPKPNEKKINKKLEKEMENVKFVIQAILSGREKVNLGVRWPLKEVIVVTKNKEAGEAVKSISELIKMQTNVKEVYVEKEFKKVKSTIKVDYKQVGFDFKQDTPKIVAKLSQVSPESILEAIEKKGKYELKINGKQIAIIKEYLLVKREIPSNFAEAEFRGGFVYVNKERTDELEAEGYAREAMRHIQALRKEAGLEKNDRIALFIKCKNEMLEFLKKWEIQIKEKTGAKAIEIAETEPVRKHKEHSKQKIKEHSLEIWFSKV